MLPTQIYNNLPVFLQLLRVIRRVLEEYLLSESRDGISLLLYWTLFNVDPLPLVVWWKSGMHGTQYDGNESRLAVRCFSLG